MNTNLYKILDLAKTATAEEIKAAFKRLAGKHHPDREHGNTEKFQKIQHAYAVLSNPKRKESYDRTGEDKQGKDPMDEAKSNLAQLFASVIQQDQKGDIVAIVAKLIDFNVNRGIAEFAELTSKKISLENKLGRIVNKDQSCENLYEGVLNGQIGILKMQIEKAKHFSDMGVMMRNLLESYEDTTPDVTTPANFVGVTNQMGNWTMR